MFSLLQNPANAFEKKQVLFCSYVLSCFCRNKIKFCWQFPLAELQGDYLRLFWFLAPLAFWTEGLTMAFERLPCSQYASWGLEALFESTCRDAPFFNVGTRASLEAKRRKVVRKYFIDKNGYQRVLRGRRHSRPYFRGRPDQTCNKPVTRTTP